MMIEIAFTQHSGKKHRTQQDALWNGNTCFQEADLPVSGYCITTRELLLAVADGVSVSPSPHLASRFSLETLARVYSNHGHLDTRLIRRVHGLLCDRYAKGRTFGASTTIVAAQIREQHCVVLNVGDSRAYLISSTGEWHRLSRDHTVLERLIGEGNAKSNEQYAQIYDALEYCLIANDEETDFPIHRAEIPFMPGDTLLLCSDGVHDCLGEPELQRLFDSACSPREQVTIWRNAILNAGAPDNFSLIIARAIQND